MAATIPDLQDIEALLRRVVREEIRSLHPEAMTVEQAAGYTGRAPATIRGWLLAGLPATRKGRRVYVKRADLDEWLLRPAREGETDALVASLRSIG